MDQNKTALTQRITATAASYLDAIGCKPVESEVPVAASWIADLASYCYPTQTEFRYAKWHKRFGQPSKEIYDVFRHWRQRIGGLVTVLVEVKITKADLMGDMERKIKAASLPATYCYLAAPHALWNDVGYISGGWGELHMSEDGRTLIKAAPGTEHAQHPGDMADFIAQVGIRRDHRTRHRALRDMMCSHNAMETDRKRTRTLKSVVRGVLGYLFDEGMFADAESLEQALRWDGVRINIDDSVTQKLLGRLEALKGRISTTGEDEA